MTLDEIVRQSTVPIAYKLYGVVKRDPGRLWHRASVQIFKKHILSIVLTAPDWLLEDLDKRNEALPAVVSGSNFLLK